MSVLGLAATVGMMAPGAATAGATATTPVGTWEGTVNHGDGSGQVTLSFHKGGLVCLSSGDGSGGGGQGLGIWNQTGDGTFTYRIVERLYESDGTTVGYVDVNQKAIQQSDAVDSSGTSRVYDGAGTYLASVEAKVSVKRVSTTPRC
ncbi:hypothetical protein GCM10010420_00230 [Streptomyces glaucosporus]|uniref:Secreted protein n=1 Tax=Streptomyces glaucosporus TaxID=284044 RepID=A0ABN3HJY7_9ACTN